MSTTFGIAVKKRLLDIGKNQSWLIDQVREKTGLFCDSSTMSRLLSGGYSSGNMKTAVCEILEIKEE